MGRILKELSAHLPYSSTMAVVSLLILGIITMANALDKLVLGFHLFHPAHLLLSATATTAMFWRYNQGRFIMAVVIGIVGTIVPCGLSDIFVPYGCGLVLGQQMELHICFIDHFWFVAPFVVAGVGIGMWSGQFIGKSTFFSHSAHVFVSTMASVLYLVAFGLADWFNYLGWIFLMAIGAVLIPCCFSDIVFPLLFTHRKDAEDAKPKG